MKKKKWKWISHILRKEQNNLAKRKLDYQPGGKKKRGRLDNSWKVKQPKNKKKLDQNRNLKIKQKIEKYGKNFQTKEMKTSSEDKERKCAVLASQPFSNIG